MATKKNNYSFPILKNKNILSCLHELGIGLQLEQLKEPKCEQMKAVYERFVNFMTGESLEQLKQPKLEAMDQLQYPELHEESIPESNILKKCIDLLRAAGIDDISMRDILFPEYNKTRRNLSALINFAKFREERMQLYEEYQARSEELIDQKQVMEYDNARMKAVLTELQEQAEERAPIVESLKAEIQEIETDIFEQNEHQTREREEIKKLKNDITVLTDKNANDKFMVVTATQENDSLRQQVVKSPEKLKKRLREMTTTVEEEKAALQDATVRHRELSGKYESLARVIEKVEKRVKDVEECSAANAKAKEVTSEIQEVATVARENERIIQDSMDDIMRLKKKISEGQDKRFRLQKHFEEKRQRAVSAQQEVLDRKMKLMRKNVRDRAIIEQTEALCAQREAEIQSMREDHKRECAYLREKYQDLNNQLSDYHQKVLSAIQCS